MDPWTAAILGGGSLLGAIGSGITGNQQNKMSKEQLAEQAREYNTSQNFTQQMGQNADTRAQVGDINQLQRQIEMGSLRDKTLYMLGQRMGMVPQAFNPRDMMNPQSSGNTTPSQGGVDFAKLQGAMGSYQAPDFTGGTYARGSGGVDPHMYSQLLARLGVSGPINGQTIGSMAPQTSPVSGGYGQGVAPPTAPRPGGPNPGNMGGGAPTPVPGGNGWGYNPGQQNPYQSAVNQPPAMDPGMSGGPMQSVPNFNPSLLYRQPMTRGY